MNGLSCVASFLRPLNPMTIAARSTWILKRKYEPYLSKVDGDARALRMKHKIYEVVDFLVSKKRPPLPVILTQDVDGIGLKGSVVELKPTVARKKVLLPLKGVYVTPENLAKHEKKSTDVEEDSFSSPFAAMTLRELSTRVFPVVMNGSNKWTIEKWHLMLALRHFSYLLPEDALEFPRDGQITGPDDELEGKEFYAFVTLNNREKTPVRFRIEHYYKDIERRSVKEQFYWETPAGEVFPEDKPVLDELRAKYDAIAKEKVHRKVEKALEYAREAATGSPR